MAEVISFKPPQKHEHKCAFCGKTEKQVARMIKAETGYCICNECVMVCKKRLDESCENYQGGSK